MTRKQSDNQNEAVAAPTPAPRERVLAAAGELFYNDGIRATGVDAIAARGNTTKMAIYRHFQSKDVLVTEWLRQVIDDYWRALDAIEAAHPDDPRAQILGWVTYFSDEARAWSHRGCAFINSIAELPDPEHPGRKLIEEHKARQWRRLASLCEQAGLASPEDTASELTFIFEGAQVSAQNRSIRDADRQLRRIVDAVIARQATVGRR